MDLRGSFVMYRHYAAVCGLGWDGMSQVLIYKIRHGWIYGRSLTYIYFVNFILVIR